MKTTKIYNILFVILFIMSFYGFIYEKLLYNPTYKKYALKYFEDGNTYPQYSIGSPPKHDPTVYELYGIPRSYEILHRIFKFVSDFTFFALVPMFVWAVILFFKKRLYLNYKFLIYQLIGFFLIIFFIIDTLKFIFN